jgi:3-(3-hydroxy-phenyl)propionate hydroxylase
MSSGQTRHISVAIVGAGPVGLTAAIDLRLHGIEAEIYDEEEGVCDGSRAIAWAKRTLEIYDRLGLGNRMREKGTTWQHGKVFWETKLIYDFDLMSETGNANPAFVNMQQYKVEELLIERLLETGAPPLCWRHKLVAVEQGDSGVTLTLETPSGPRSVICNFLLACDGARSTIRRLLGLNFEGQVFHDQFLISDVRMKADFPTERWFWFNPPFNKGQSALLHKQTDDVWRIDQQLGRHADAQAERAPDRVRSRLSAMLGPNVAYDLEWISVYTFQCRRLDRFRHGRILFVGDSAHQVSPFGGRGGNSGIQDADNLVWKLALVLNGTSPDALLDSYDDERVPAADENIGHSTRATDFISPKSPVATAFRDAVLSLSERFTFARAFVNSGRLSTPTQLLASPLNTPDMDAFNGGVPPGGSCVDAPVTLPNGRAGWLLEQLGGDFTVLVFADSNPAAEIQDQLAILDTPIKSVPVSGGPTADGFTDSQGLATKRYDGAPGTVYLIRPDQHVAARFRHFDVDRLRGALSRAMGQVSP